MKLCKLLLTSSAIAIPTTIITPMMVSCTDNGPLVAHIEDNYIFSDQNEINVPIKFTGAPINEVSVSLSETFIDLTLSKSVYPVKNGQANITLKVDSTVKSSKEWKFDLCFRKVDLSQEYILEGLDVVYEYQQPSQRDIVVLQTTQFVESTKYECKFDFLFSGELKSSDIVVELMNKDGTDVGALPTGSHESIASKDDTRWHLHYSVPLTGGTHKDTGFIDTFDIQLTFWNSYNIKQIELITNCGFTYIK